MNKNIKPSNPHGDTCLFNQDKRGIVNRLRAYFKRNFNVFTVIAFVLLIIYCASLIFTLLWGMMNSMKGRYDFRMNPFGWPEIFVWQNYVNAFNSLSVPIQTSSGGRSVFMLELFFNTIVYAIGATFFATISPCITAYAVAKYKFKLGPVLYTIVIVTMLLPIVGALPSEMLIVRSLGFYDNIVGVWLMKGSFLGINFLIFYATFKSFSWDFAEAAFIDGASHFKVLARIMLPLARTTIFAVGLLVFIGFWNEYQTQLIYLPSMPSVAYGLFLFQFEGQSGAAVSTIPVRLAGCMLVSVPIFIIYMIFKDMLIGNIAVGGIKG